MLLLKFAPCALALGLFVACDTPRTRDASTPATIRLIDHNPVLVPGRRSIFAASLTTSPQQVAMVPSDLTIRLDDDELPARIYWAWTQVPAAAARSTWLPAPLRWHLTLEPPAGGAYAAPMIVADLPARADADWLQVGDLRVRPTLLTENGALWQQDLREPRHASSRLLDVVRPEAEDPARCWRAALLADRLHSPQVRPRFADPLVQDLADQQITRWRAALDRLAAADLDLAREIRRRLTLVCNDEDVLVPAWTSDQQELADLLQILLSPAHDESSRTTLARDWLSTQPPLIAWRETSGEAERVALGLANLTNRPLQVELRWQESEETLPTLEVAPESISRTQLSLPLAQSARQPLHTLSIEFESRGSLVHFPRGSTSAAPPGLMLAPFMQPHSLQSWQKDQVLVESDEQATRAMLRRTDVGWELFIECRLPEPLSRAIQAPALAEPFADSSVSLLAAAQEPLDPMFLRAEDLTTETVYLFVGPTNSPIAVLALTPAGEVVTFRGTVAAKSVRFSESARSWSATISIPAQWIGADGTLALGLLRSFASENAPTSFPQPVFPWRLDPGRLLIDLTQWDDLAGARPL